MAIDLEKNAPTKEDIPVPSNNGLIDKRDIDFSKTTPKALDPSDQERLTSPNNRIVQVSYEPENSANYKWHTVAISSLEEFVNQYVFGENDKSGFYTQSLFKQNSHNSNYGNKKENLVSSGGFLILDIDNDIDNRSLGDKKDPNASLLRTDTTHDLSMQKAKEILEKAQLNGVVVPTKSHLKEKHKDFYQKGFLQSFNFKDESELPPHKMLLKGVSDDEFSAIFGMKFPSMSEYEKETHTDKKNNATKNYYTFDVNLVPQDRLEAIKEQYVHRIAYRFHKSTERFRVIVPVAPNATLSGEFLQNDGIYKEFLNQIVKGYPALKELFDAADVCGTRPSQIFKRSPENLKHFTLYSSSNNSLEIQNSASVAIFNYQEKTFQKALERYNRLKEIQQKKIEVSNEQIAKLKKYPNRLLVNLINLENKKKDSYLDFEKTRENFFNLALSNEQWVDIFKAITGWQPEKEEAYGTDYISLDERHGPTVLIGSMVGGITPLNPSAVAEFGEHKSMFGFVKERLGNNTSEAYQFIQNQLGESFIVYRGGGGLTKEDNYQIINEIIKEAAERNPTNYLNELHERFRVQHFVISRERAIAFSGIEVPMFQDNKMIATRKHHEAVEIPLNDETLEAIKEAKKKDTNNYSSDQKSLYSKKPPLDVFKSAIRSGIPISDDETLLQEIPDDSLRSDIRTAAKLLALATESVGNNSGVPYDPNANLLLKSVLANLIGMRSKSASESIQKLQSDKQYCMRNPQELDKIDQKINEIMEAFSNSKDSPLAMQLDFIGEKPAITGWSLAKDGRNKPTFKTELLKIDPLFAQKIHANAQKNTHDTRKYKEVIGFIQSCNGDYEKMFSCNITKKQQDEKELDYSVAGFIKPQKTKKIESKWDSFEHTNQFPEENSSEEMNGVRNAILVEKKRAFNQQTLKQESHANLFLYNEKDLVNFIFNKNTLFSKMDFGYNLKQTLFLNNDQVLDTICHFINLSRNQVSMPNLDPVELKKNAQFSLDGKSAKYSLANNEHIIIKRNDDGAISGIFCNNVNGISHCNERYKNLFELVKHYHFVEDNEVINEIAKQSKAFTPKREIAPPSDLVFDFVFQKFTDIVSTRGVKDPDDLFLEEKPELLKEVDALTKAVLGLDSVRFKKVYRFHKDTPLLKRLMITINIFKPTYLKNLKKECHNILVLQKNGITKEIPLVYSRHNNKLIKQTEANYKKGVCKSVETYLYEHGLKPNKNQNSAKMKI